MSSTEQTTSDESQPSVEAESGNAFVRLIKNIIGPAAIMAAGMIGAGAVSTRLLAGTWFGFDLLWAALYVIPMVIFTLDSCSRVGILSGDRGMLDMIRTEISPALAWFMFLPQVLLNIIVNVGQISVMSEAGFSVFGVEAAEVSMGPQLLLSVVLSIIVLVTAVSGSFKRLQGVMTGLLMLILVCFIAVAVKGLFSASTWLGLVGGLVPAVPADLPVRGTQEFRGGFTQLMAIAGQALPAAVFLSYGYFTSNAKYTSSQLKENLKKTVINFGLIWGLFSVVVVVCGVTALHNVYQGESGGLHYSQIASVSQAGATIAPALPVSLSYMATPIFSMGLLVAAFTTMVSVALMMTYFTLDMLQKDWKLSDGNTLFRVIFGFYVIVPGILAPFWSMPALIKAIIGMAGNLLMAPLALIIIMYFINNKRYVGEHTASPVRNLVLTATFLFSLYVVVRGVVNLATQV
ncbi:MAG: divalent metal cation transporter [Myxococcales bacterium]|nr:divalent metal cation transporter [Myxococcales bacterium]